MNLSINVSKIYFDSDGVLIDKNTLPVELQSKMPFFIMGKYDFDCNYKNAIQNAEFDTWKFLGVSNRVPMNFLFTGYNEIQSPINSGDVVLLFVDDEINPSYYSAIILKTPNFGFSGVVQNVEFKSMDFTLDSDKPDKDYLSIFKFLEVSRLGQSSKSFDVSISSFYVNTPPNNRKIIINRKTNFDKSILMIGYIDFETEYYNLDFRKIEVAN